MARTRTDIFEAVNNNYGGRYTEIAATKALGECITAIARWQEESTMDAKDNMVKAVAYAVVGMECMLYGMTNDFYEYSHDALMELEALADSAPKEYEGKRVAR